MTETWIQAIPAATLPKGLVNPTGAGNAFAAAYMGLKGSGWNTTESAVWATAVGAVFCQYDHCPPYNYATLQQVVAAAAQVRAEIQPPVISGSSERIHQEIEPTS